METGSTGRPNLLFLMTDQMQGRLLEPGHPCPTPNFDRLITRGVRFERGYTPNPVCSPARASLMTGLLPHNHGVLHVTHAVDEDQCRIRPTLHWADQLKAAGYRTAYCGKWHVDRAEDPTLHGWEVDFSAHSAGYRAEQARRGEESPELEVSRFGTIQGGEGYHEHVLWRVDNQPESARACAIVADQGLEILRGWAGEGSGPWACFLSCQEPHDPFYTNEESWEQVRDAVKNWEPPENWRDNLEDRPALYRRAARVFAGIEEADKREIAGIYWAMVWQIDRQYGRVLDYLEESGQVDNTLVVLTSDHGEFLGAHGLYQKNISAFEEAYHIPMVLAGPGVARGGVSPARVGLHDLAPTLLDLLGVDPIPNRIDGRSFAGLARNPADCPKEWLEGYAESYGTRYWIVQKVYWRGDWKLVFNLFDEDELYNLAEDPGELYNLAQEPAYRKTHEELMRGAWRKMKESGDSALIEASYASIRLGVVGPHGV